MYPKNIHDADTYAQLLARLDALSVDSHPRWGTMSVAQMLAHCAEVQEVQNGKELKGTPFFIRWLGPLVKGRLLSLTPYPRNLRTHPQYVISDPQDFTQAKARLRAAMEAMRAGGAKGYRHPIFGQLTAEEGGWMVWKHLDHHLQQFGV